MYKTITMSEREEGEISDDENEIIQRIKEYESKNNELEQIAQINSYSPYKRPKSSDFISDLSTISSEELSMPYTYCKRRRYNIKARKKYKRQCKYRSYLVDKINQVAKVINKRQSQYQPPRTIHSHERINDEYDSNSRSSIKVFEISDDSEQDSRDAVVTREELRLALTHNFTATKVSRVTLKERLQRDSSDKNVVASEVTSETKDAKQAEKFDNCEEDSLEENELRMIALKSAVLRKHMARKKRDAEVAYSPTDFDATLANVNNMVDNEIEEIPIYSMDTSPLSSPSSNMSVSMSASLADNKTVDMDIASSDSDMEVVMLYNNDGKSNECDFDPGPYRVGHYDKSNEYLQTANLTPPPPPSITSNFHMYWCENDAYIPHNNDNNNQLSNFSSTYNSTHTVAIDSFVEENATNDVDNCTCDSQIGLKGGDSDFGPNVEEEEALRALLLAKLGSATTRKRNAENKVTNNSLPRRSNTLQRHFEPFTSHINDASSESTSQCLSTELILKKAVLRFNNNSALENSLNSDIENTRCNGQSQVQPSTDYDDTKTIETKEWRQSPLTTTKTDTSNDNTYIVKECKKQHIKTAPFSSKTKAKVAKIIKNAKEVYKRKKNITTNSKFTSPRKQQVPIASSLPMKSITRAISPVTEVQKHVSSASAPSSCTNSKSLTGGRITRSKSADEIQSVEHDSSTQKKNDLRASLQQLTVETTSIPSAVSSKVSKIILPQPSAPSSPVSPATVLSKTSSVGSSASRLITSANLPDLKVKKLVIHVNVSDSDEDITSSAPAHIHDVNTPATLLSSKFFEDRIDMFLKNMRSSTGSEKIVENTPAVPRKEEQQSVNFITPQAVKHLPKAAQEEYLQLVNRMNLLQQKKKLKITKNTNNGSVSQPTDCVKQNELVAVATAMGAAKVKKSVDQSESTLKDYENLLHKIGVRIITQLDKSLQMVQDARTVKIEKLRSEQRLKRLRAELDQEQQRFRVEQQKMQKLSPAISEVNDEIMALKQKRLRLLKMANSVGKNVRGSEHRSTNEFKHEISLKSKKLASCIKVVNSIKFKNLEEFDATRTPISSIEKSQPAVEQVLPLTELPATQKDVFPNGTEDNVAATSPKLPTENEEPPRHTSDVIDVTCDKEQQVSSALSAETTALQNYISPLSHYKLDVNGIVCPYELMGECKDSDCNYVHLARKQAVP